MYCKYLINHGKCKALEVSDDPQKQKQINDLMEKVEFFSNSLITITRVFFDQLYRAKEGSSQSIARSTAMIKTAMIERNLLERTCDVRWWALEKAFSECITLSNNSYTGIKNVNNKSQDEKLQETKNKTLDPELKTSVEFACRRLEDIRNSYTLYRDLVIVNLNGIVIANSNENRRNAVIGVKVSDEDWF